MIHNNIGVMPVTPFRNQAQAQPRVQFGLFYSYDEKSLEISKLSDTQYLELLLKTRDLKIEQEARVTLPSGATFRRYDLVGNRYRHDSRDVELISRLNSTWDIDFLDAVEQFYRESPDSELSDFTFNALVKARHRIKGEQVRANRFGPL